MRSGALIAVLLIVTGCAQTLRQRYIDASDPCSSAREPIVTAGDELDTRQRAAADQVAAREMQGHELPVVTQNGNQMQLNFGNALVNALNQAALSQQAYLRIKQSETGENAAAMLTSIQGDARGDLARLQSVTTAMQGLRTCRATQIASAQSSTGPASERLERLKQQQAKLVEDDQLISQVFGQYGTRADMYASAAATVPASAPSRPVRGHSRQAAPPKNPVDALKDDQHNAQLADRKQSETLHQTLQSAIAGT
jgi:hypothetical protein